MLETANATRSEIYPLSMLANGGDGKRRLFHLVHCMAQPPCDATLRLSPGKHGRLPPECVAKFAAQKGWLADRKGYALCPEHKPGGAYRPPSDMPPQQKRAAFLAIRDRNLAAAAGRMMKPAAPVGAIAEHTARVRAAVAAAQTSVDRFDDAVDLNANERRTLAFIAAHPNRVWSSRREAARRGDFNIWTFNGFVEKAIRLGLVVQEPVAGRTHRPFRLRLVDKFDPPAMQPEPMKESAMPDEEAVVVAVQPVRAEPPPEPTLEANRRIRDYLDGHFDDVARRYCGEVSDAYVAKKLGVPRAWVASIRSALYGPDDRNEADDRASGEAEALATRAAALEASALDLATKAETLGRDVRQFLEGRRL